MHLPTAQPFDGAAVLDFLAARAITGVEEVRDGTYRRTLALPHGAAILELTPDRGGVTAEFTLDDERDEPEAIRRARALFGLDADPRAVAAHFDGDPHLGPLVRARPGLRVPGVVDGWEIAARAVLGQQITVAAARTLASRITAAVATPLAARRRRAHPSLPDPGPGCRRARRALHDAALARPHAARARRRRSAARRAARRRGAPSALGHRPLDRGLRRDAPRRPRRLPRRRRRGPKGAARTRCRPGRSPPSWAPWRSFAVLHLWASLADTPA